MQHDSLILSKDSQELSVALKKKLPQHQLDGIRFLYRQFKLKRPGAILNDPTGYGKRLQVVLFLKAISPVLTLNKPILILCHEHDVQNWMEHFQQWTDCLNEISINSSTPFSKSAIFINPLKDCLTFSRRQWSVVVVSSDAPSKEVLQSKVKGDFKIWVSNADHKENLQSFTSIYKWLYPKETFNIKEYTPTNNSMTERVKKAVKLACFLEDVSIRRTHFNEPFDVPEKPDTPAVPRKNKDPTGLKVKRSNKRKIDDTTNTQNGDNHETSAKNNTSNGKGLIDNENQPKENTNKILQAISDSKTYNLSSISDNDPMINEFNFLNKPNDIKDDYECDNENLNENDFKNSNRKRRANMYTEESTEFESEINDMEYNQNNEINFTAQGEDSKRPTQNKKTRQENNELWTEVLQTCKNVEDGETVLGFFSNNHSKTPMVGIHDDTSDFQTQLERSGILNHSLLDAKGLQDKKFIQNNTEDHQTCKEIVESLTNKNDTKKNVQNDIVKDFRTAKEDIIISESPTKDSTDLSLINSDDKIVAKTLNKINIDNLSLKSIGSKSQFNDGASKNNDTASNNVDKSKVHETAYSLLDTSQNSADVAKNESIPSINDAKSSKNNEASKYNLVMFKTNPDSSNIDVVLSKNNLDTSKIDDASKIILETSKINGESSKNGTESLKNMLDTSKNVLAKNDDTFKKDKTDNNVSSNKPRTVLSSLKDLDDTLLECERQARQSFKGSIFDTLFNKK